MSHALTSCLLLFTTMLLLASCGAESGKFRLEGRLRNMNQGEFWVFSPDGAIDGIDTIKVRDGRFSYEIPLLSEATLIVVFPNYSEQPVFAKSGKKVSIKGDATHLKEMIIQGSDENEDMTTLRMELNDLTPPDIPAAVSTFITENPASLVSIYLVQRYFIHAEEPDYQQAAKLVNIMMEANPDNGQLMLLKKQLASLQGGAVKSRLPKFTVVDVKGRKVTEGDLKCKANVVTAWATWSYQSDNMQNRLAQLKKRYGDQLGVVSICVDGSPENCRRRIARDSLKWSTVCDGRMFESPLMAKFGLGDVPSNIVINGQGRIVARNLTVKKLEEQIEKMLKR